MIPNAISHVHAGAKEGPHILVLGGTHGDEQTGIEVVRHFRRRLDLESSPSGRHKRDGVRGHFYFGFGNPEAVEQGVRGLDARGDLNRCCLPHLMDPVSTPEAWPDLIRARELAPLLEDVDLLLDLHSVSNPDAKPFGWTEGLDGRHEHYYRLIPTRYIVADLNGLLGHDLGLTEPALVQTWVMRHGGIGIGFETGYQEDTTRIPLTINVVCDILLETGVITRELYEHLRDDTSDIVRPDEQTVINLAHCEIASGEFAYVDGMCRNFHQVTRGQTIGHYTSGPLSGGLIGAATDGFLVFPRVPERVVPGEALFFIGEPV